MNESTSSDYAKSALVAIATFALFATFGTFLKLSREQVPTIFAIWSRFGIGSVVLSVWCLRKHPFSHFIPQGQLPLHLNRIVFSLLAFWCFAYAAPLLPVSDSIALQFSIPIILAILARYMLGEELPNLRKLAIVFGIIGVLLVARPTGDGSLYAALIVLTGCAFAAYSDIQVKILARTVAPELIALYLFLSGFLVFSLLLPWGLVMPSGQACIFLIVMALAGTTAQVMLGILFTQMPASAIAPFVYTSFIWSVIYDITIWHNVPDALGIVGAMCIMFDGVLAYWSLKIPSKTTKPSR